MTTQKDLNEFWMTSFGDEYVDRHEAERLVPAKRFMFQTILQKTSGIASVMELGTNQGFNLRVLHEILPDAELHGVEINEKAAALARKVEGVASITCASLLDVPVERTFDLSFTAGVLIHLSPEVLPKAYEQLYRFSRRYVVMCEYHNPSPEEIPYRGHRNRMYKRDFAGEMLDAYPDIGLLDYGFFYRKDERYRLGDVHWFLLEKKQG